MRLDDDQELTLPEMLESARSFPAEVTTPDPEIPTGNPFSPSEGASRGEITIPDCCISLVDGPLVGLSTSEDAAVSLLPEGAGRLAGPGLLPRPTFLDRPSALDPGDALRRGLVEGIPAGARP